MKKIYKLEAYVELDIEAIVEEIRKNYGENFDIRNLGVDDILQYVESHTKPVVGKGGGVNTILMGPSFEGFTSDDFDRIDKILDEIIENEIGEQRE